MNNNINSFINLLLKTIEEDKVFVMPINGTSMLPFLDSSKKVKLKKVESLKKGEMYFYKRENGQYVLHRLIKIKKYNLIFRGDNQFINENGIKESQIIAKVVEIIDENGTINNLSSFSYKISSRRFCVAFQLYHYVLVLLPLFCDTLYCIFQAFPQIMKAYHHH